MKLSVIKVLVWLLARLDPIRATQVHVETEGVTVKFVGHCEEDVWSQITVVFSAFIRLGERAAVADIKLHKDGILMNHYPMLIGVGSSTKE